MGKTFSTGLLTNGIWQDASNNIGIGGSPSGSFKFEVTGTTKTSDTIRILTGANTTDISYAVGKEMSSNNAAFFGWRFNSGGTPYGFISMFGTTGRFTLMPDGGNVGIANTNPFSPLHINSNGAFSTSGNMTSGLIISNTNFGRGINIGVFDASAYAYIQAAYVNNADTTFALALQPRGGNVGIGTSSPQDYPNYRILHIAGPATNGSGLLYLTNSNNSIVGLMFAEGSASRVTFGSQTNHPVTFVSNDTERMRITSGGSVLINTTTSNQGYPLEIQAGGGGEQIWLKRSAANAQIFMGGGTAAETILFIRANGSNGVYMTANATSWTSNSDETIKDIIEPITNGLDKLKDIRTVIYKFKNDKEGSRKVGLIAQDVEKILPEAITKTYQNEYDKEVLGLNYTDLVPVLVKAIQELNDKVSALENKS
jgi:hypothetical protein